MLPLSYRWFKNGALIPSATDSVLSLTEITLADAGTYTVEIANEFQTVTASTSLLAGDFTLAGMRMETGEFRIEASGLPVGASVLLLRSGNLVDWQPIATIPFTGEPILIESLAEGEGQAVFYRVVVQ